MFLWTGLVFMYLFSSIILKHLEKWQGGLFFPIGVGFEKNILPHLFRYAWNDSLDYLHKKNQFAPMSDKKFLTLVTKAELKKFGRESNPHLNGHHWPSHSFYHPEINQSSHSYRKLVLPIWEDKVIQGIEVLTTDHIWVLSIFVHHSTK